MTRLLVFAVLVGGLVGITVLSVLAIYLVTKFNKVVEKDIKSVLCGHDVL